MAQALQVPSSPSDVPLRYEVVPYDPRWPAIFERERATIAAALGERAVAIEHFGSTAVPGLAAKPIIDILVGLVRLGPLEDYAALLRGAGYQRHPQGGA